MNEAKRLKMLWKKLMKLLKDTWDSYTEYLREYGWYYQDGFYP